METDLLLGPEYGVRTLELGSDGEGELVATLVSRRTESPSTRAVLYVHGFVDYFFQAHLADFYLAQGFDFYALDLRKYGRSLRAGQTPNMIGSLTEYFEEIDAAVRIIREEEGHDVLLVNGHSTGCLITALWADRARGQGVVQGLFFNSPFFDMNVPGPVRVAGDLFSRLFPAGWKLPAGVSQRYVRSLHRDFEGEWDFDLTLKPAAGFGVRVGWLAAIRRGHRRLQEGLHIDVPVLVMASDRSVRPTGKADISAADAVLDVEHMVRWSPGLGEDVTLVRIAGGVHDLVLSAPAVRATVFEELAGWLKTALPA